MVNPNYQSINVQQQENDSHSILSFYKEMIRIRRMNEGLIYGSFKEYLPEHEQIYIYERRLDEKCYLVMVNLTEEAAAYSFTNELQGDWQLLLTNHSHRPFEKEGILPPYEALLFEKISNSNRS